MNNNSKKNNKKRRLFVIILISAISFVLLWCIGFFALSYHNRQIQENGLFGIVVEQIKNDEDFNNNYGNVTSVEKDTDNKRQRIESGEYSIPCIVTVEDGEKYRIWISINFKKSEENYDFHITKVEAFSN